MEAAALVPRRVKFTSRLEWRNGRRGFDEDRARVTRETLDLTKERSGPHFLLIDLILRIWLNHAVELYKIESQSVMKEGYAGELQG